MSFQVPLDKHSAFQSCHNKTICKLPLAGVEDIYNVVTQIAEKRSPQTTNNLYIVSQANVESASAVGCVYKKRYHKIIWFIFYSVAPTVCADQRYDCSYIQKRNPKFCIKEKNVFAQSYCAKTCELC